MSDLPGYDDWKTSDPSDDCCQHCGVDFRSCRSGWQPGECTGECRRAWRDPDDEYERMRDEPPEYDRGDDD